GVPPVAETLAGLVRQAGLVEAPAGLVSATGSGGYLAVQEHMAAADGFQAGAWRSRTRGWLARGLAARQIDACPVWRDMAVRPTGIVQGLPGFTKPPYPCHVPVGGFQYDVRALARPRRVIHPLPAALPGQDRDPAGAGPGDAGREDRAADLAELPG